MGQMRTINKADWKPVQLIAPGGLRYTPGSFAEDRELRTRGYVPAPVEPAARTAPPAVGRPAPTPVPVSKAASEPDAPATGATDTPKTKTTRRSNGDAK